MPYMLVCEGSRDRDRDRDRGSNSFQLFSGFERGTAILRHLRPFELVLCFAAPKLFLKGSQLAMHVGMCRQSR